MPIQPRYMRRLKEIRALGGVGRQTFDAFSRRVATAVLVIFC